jgi:polyhydroxyalkanoate synthesis regulator phasin
MRATAIALLLCTARPYIGAPRSYKMAGPENQTLRVLRDIRAAIKAMDQKFERRFEAVDGKFDDLRSRMDNIRQAINGESVLGRYAAAEVDERLDSLEKRIAALEESH